MICVRCEVVRAKAIAMGMGGLRKTAAQITEELQGRYGMDYRLEGLKVVRATPTGDVLIYEGRR